MASDQIKAAVEQAYAWVGELAELRDVTYVDLPTDHVDTLEGARGPD